MTEQSVIQPRYVGDAVGLTPTITMLSLVFWAWVLGPLGALLAVPLSLLMRALLIEADPAAAWTLPIVSGQPADEPPEAAKEAAPEAAAPAPAGTTRAAVDLTALVPSVLPWVGRFSKGSVGPILGGWATTEYSWRIRRERAERLQVSVHDQARRLRHLPPTRRAVAQRLAVCLLTVISSVGSGITSVG